MRTLFTLLLCVGIGSLGIAQNGTNVKQAGKFTYPSELSDVWGYVDEQGNEYALVGLKDGFSVLDVTNPSTITSLYYKSGPFSTWRDVKVWDDHAYITTEAFAGLLIVDLTPLPQSNNLTDTVFFGDQFPFQRAHNIFIDEQGFAYIFGANQGEGGAIILDLNGNPKVPVEVGIVDDFYMHDGMVRNDTLWGSAIYEGLQVMYDVSDKSNPVIISSFDTPGRFAHNCWPSDDGDYVFTTDEIANGAIGAYDVSDFDNPIKVDDYDIPALLDPIPHNTFFKDNYLFTAFYSEGLHILDVTHPKGMVEVGRFDTSPLYDQGFNGAWGCYPYLPSGNILIADIQEGLYVLTPEINRASYLQGEVRDIVTNNPIEDVLVRVGVGRQFTTKRFGEYSAGTWREGGFKITFEKSGYITKEVVNVNLVNGQITTLDVFLTPDDPNALSNEETTAPKERITVYPNPVQDRVNISGIPRNALIKLYDGVGKVVAQGTSQIPTLDLKNLNRGIYLLQVETSAGVILHKQPLVKP